MSPKWIRLTIASLIIVGTLFVVDAGSAPDPDRGIVIVFGGLSSPRSILGGPDLVARLFAPLGLPWGDPFRVWRGRLN